MLGSQVTLEDFLKIGKIFEFSIAGHPQTDNQTELFNRSRWDLFLLFGDYLTSWNLVLYVIEFAYNSLVNRSACLNPIMVVIGCRFKMAIDLLSLPIRDGPSASTEAFTHHLASYHIATIKKFIPYSTFDVHKKDSRSMYMSILSSKEDRC